MSLTRTNIRLINKWLGVSKHFREAREREQTVSGERESEEMS